MIIVCCTASKPGKRVHYPQSRLCLLYQTSIAVYKHAHERRTRAATLEWRLSHLLLWFDVNEARRVGWAAGLLGTAHEFTGRGAKVEARVSQTACETKDETFSVVRPKRCALHLNRFARAPSTHFNYSFDPIATRRELACGQGCSIVLY